MSRHLQDTLAVLRGLQLVLRAAAATNEAHAQHLWTNSSLRTLLAQGVASAQQSGRHLSHNPQHELQQLLAGLRETLERGGVAAEGARQFALGASQSGVRAAAARRPVAAKPGADAGADRTSDAVPATTSVGGFDISAITLKELQSLLSHKQHATIAHAEPVAGADTRAPAPEPTKAIAKDEQYVEHWMEVISQQNASKEPAVSAESAAPSPAGVDADPAEPLVIPELSSLAKQRTVPASRLGRMASFGQLFAGLGVGTASELARGALGLGGATTMRDAVFSAANTDRIVDTLCKVRGAALKIGQILSIQDSSVVSPALVKAFERVRQAADYMPDWQVERCMRTEFGDDWRTAQLSEFDGRPFAAASIGQVHRAIMRSDGMVVAVKIQYPGVARGIESDIDNLVGMLKVWDVFPAGFFIDNIVQVAKRELRWEVDYMREAEYTEHFAEMIRPYGEYRVPKVVRSLTTGTVLTSEFVPGVPVDKCFGMGLADRHFIAAALLKLCLRELFELRCMQTDPNWSNFLYDRHAKQLVLIDFGATRFYTSEFIDNYRAVIRAALRQDGEEVLRLSRIMGFLTGYETKQMEQAHLQAVLTLGEPFRYEGEFDFGKQVSRA